MFNAKVLRTNAYYGCS